MYNLLDQIYPNIKKIFRLFEFMKTLVVHPGLQKTASTYLQHCFWPILYPEFARNVNGYPKVRSTCENSLKLIKACNNENFILEKEIFISCEKLSGVLVT